jgi:hypothetical protein
VFGREYAGTVEAYIGYLFFGIITFIYEFFLIAVGPREVNGVKMPVPISHFLGVMCLLTYVASGSLLGLALAAILFFKDIWADFFYTKIKFEIDEESFTVDPPFGLAKRVRFSEITSLDYGKGLFALTLSPVLKIRYGENMGGYNLEIPNAYIGGKWLSEIINEQLLKYGNGRVKVYDDYVKKFGYKFYDVTDDGIYYCDLPKKPVFLPWNKVRRLDYGQSWHPSSTKNYIMVHGRGELSEEIYFEFDEEQLVSRMTDDGSVLVCPLFEEIKSHCIIYPKIDVTPAFAERYEYTAVWDFTQEQPELPYDTVEGLLPDKFNIQ